MKKRVWMRVAAVAVWAVMAGGCGPAPAAREPTTAAGAVGAVEDPMAAYCVWRPAAGDGAKAWLVLLPGASGLTVFEDSEHYFRTARRLNDQGFDVLVVDYKAAYRASGRRVNEGTGEKIAWVVERAIERARASGRIAAGRPGALVGWSLGAEGLWVILADEARTRALGVRAAAMYYPSNEEERAAVAAAPLLILTGAEDDVTPAAAIRRAVARGAGASAPVELEVYEGARHGFDISSLPEKKTVSLIPVIGPRATFGYSAAADARAGAMLTEFLRRHLD